MASYPRAARVTRTSVPPLKKELVFKKPHSYSHADDKDDDNDFEVTAGGFSFLRVLFLWSCFININFCVVNLTGVLQT